MKSFKDMDLDKQEKKRKLIKHKADIMKEYNLQELLESSRFYDGRVRNRSICYARYITARDAIIDYLIDSVDLNEFCADAFLMELSIELTARLSEKELNEIEEHCNIIYKDNELVIHLT